MSGMDKTSLFAQMEIFSEEEWFELVNDLSLPRRQAEIVRHLLQGQSDRQIAMDMKISVATVRTHLSRLFSRFGVQDRCELILFVFRHFRNKSRAAITPSESMT